MNKVSRTRKGREVKRSTPETPEVPRPIVPATPLDLATLRAALLPLAEGDAWSAGLLALLEARDERPPAGLDIAALRDGLRPLAEDDAWATGLLTLLESRATCVAGPEALAFAAPLRAPFDNRFEQCFEQMLSLIHRQNVQIAELWAIISELL